MTCVGFGNGKASYWTHDAQTLLLRTTNVGVKHAIRGTTLVPIGAIRGFGL